MYCVQNIRLRMSSAFGGMTMPSASSTERTDASAWTVVQTPHVRSANAQASRGSRPRKMISSPRTIVPELNASVTKPSLTSTSTRRWPSMRVTGSMTILLAAIKFLVEIIWLGLGTALFGAAVFHVFARRHFFLDQFSFADVGRNRVRRNADHRRRAEPRRRPCPPWSRCRSRGSWADAGKTGRCPRNWPRCNRCSRGRTGSENSRRRSSASRRRRYKSPGRDSPSCRGNSRAWRFRRRRN